MEPSIIAIIMASILATERVFQLVFNRMKKSKCSNCLEIEMQDKNDDVQPDEKEIDLQSLNNVIHL